MNDSWTAPLSLDDGRVISGGAARNKRIAASGGMDSIIENIVRLALIQANAKLNQYGASNDNIINLDRHRHRKAV